MIAKEYAKALFAAQNPKLSRLRDVLKRRGHEKLLPRIFAEYQKLILARERSAMHRDVTPERERTRTLLELYKKLIHNSYSSL